MKKTLCLVFLCTLNAAFAQTQTPPPEVTEIPVASDTIPFIKPLKDKSKNVETVFDEEKLATFPLTKEVLFQVLIADIAVQRGQWQNAFVTLVELARQTKDWRLARRAAEIAMAAQRINEALAAVKTWKRLSPTSVDAEQFHLHLLTLKNDLNEIQKYFRAKLNNCDDIQVPLVFYEAQSVLSQASDQAAAFNVLEKLIKPYDKSVDTHIVMSRAAFSNKDTALSIAEAKSALAMEPSSESAILALAQALDQEAAFAVIAEFLEKNPEARTVRLTYANMLFEHKRYHPARLVFEEVLRDQEKNGGASMRTLSLLGVINMSLNNPDQAEAYFLRFLKERSADDNASTIFFNLAQLEQTRTNLAQAERWLSQINFDNGKNRIWFPVQLQRAELFARLGELEKAMKIIRDLRPNKESDEVSLLRTEAKILRNAQKQQESYEVLKSGAEVFTKSDDLIYEYGMQAEALGHYEEMESALRSVIALVPFNADAYNALGFSFVERNIRLKDALELLEKAMELSPEDPFILDSVAWAQYRLGNLNEAEVLLRKSIAIHKDPDVSVHLAEVLWVQNRKEEALNLLREVQTKDAKNELLDKTLKHLNILLK